MDLSGFKKLEIIAGEPFMSITDHATAFNQNAVIKLGCPEKVCLLFNYETKQLAIQPSDKDDTTAIPFMKPGRDAAKGARFNSKDLQYSLARQMGWDIDRYIYRINGAYYEENNVMVFDLTTATKSPKRSRK